MKREKNVIVRVTEKELKILNSFAYNEGRPLSDLVRAMFIEPIMQHCVNKFMFNDTVLYHKPSLDDEDIIGIGVYIGSLEIGGEAHHVIEEEGIGLNLFDWAYSIHKIEEDIYNNIQELIEDGVRIKLEDYSHLL